MIDRDLAHHKAVEKAARELLHVLRPYIGLAMPLKGEEDEFHAAESAVGEAFRNLDHALSPATTPEFQAARENWERTEAMAAAMQRGKRP